ncbi:protein Shroom4 isoform X3 [Cololabis saira]|nr:protein Shroom4 isoform X3 [Cololabis saira]
MQLHPGPYTLPWHTTDSDLSMQWAQLPISYSSTERSSSLGSMESLDAPTPTAQPYSDSHSSPVDPSLFNNKRDSAYSSFSASSNTSDYAAVPLRPGEACSMDNLLHSLGPGCRGGYPGDASHLERSAGGSAEEAHLKSRSLTRPRPRPVELKERPSSCCYEQEQRGRDFRTLRNGETGGDRRMNPPQPPVRKDSFRATRSRPNTPNRRCTSAPIENSSVPYEEHKSLNMESGLHNGFPASKEGDQTGNMKMDAVDTHFSQRQTGEFQHSRCDGGGKKDLAASKDPVTSSGRTSLSSETSVVPEQPHIPHSQSKHSAAVLHRHSAPEKLLATQLQLLQFERNGSSSEACNPSDTSELSSSPCSSQWSHSSSLHPATEDQETFRGNPPASNKWGGSRCSTPGSVFLEEDGEDADSSERLEGADVNGTSLSPVHHHVPWGRSVSVPGEPTTSSSQERLSSGQVEESDFRPLSAAASMDTLLEEQMMEERRISGGKKEESEQEEYMKKSESSKNYRRNRRRSERFATNLRNEIQRKKAQLQRGRGPGGLLCSGETVHEEESSDLCEEGTDPDPSGQKKGAKVAFASPPISPGSQSSAQFKPSNTSSESNCEVQFTSYAQNNIQSASVQILDPGLPDFGVGIRVVEEPAPAGKARRWRWTPEHKLQPEPEGDRRGGVVGEKVLGVTGSRHGVCAFTSSSTSPSSPSYSRSSSNSRLDEPVIPPFADRMKFFEETCRGTSASSVSNVPSYRQRKAARPPEQHAGEIHQHPTQRRYSYQGALLQESVRLPNATQARTRSASTARERQNEREESSRMRERQHEMERQEREAEVEDARLRKMQQEREQEERVRQWKMERERELEREKEMQRARETEEREKELERGREKEREDDCQLTSYPECNSNSDNSERNQGFQHQGDFRSFEAESQTYSHIQPFNQAPRSAFYPVNPPFQPPANQQPLHREHPGRCYTPTEAYPARQETAKLDRKFSLTERDYRSWRRESRAPPGLNQHQSHHHPARWDSGRADSSGDSRNGYAFAPAPAPLSLRGRAMSENDLRFDSSHRWSPSISAATSQTLSEIDEGPHRRFMGGNAEGTARQNRKKMPPPPRPPPPKWEQFHRRRASHHTLFYSSSSSSTSSAPPVSINTTAGHYQSHSSSYVPPPETSRQRSYSLPPERQEVAESCPRCTCNQTQTQERTAPHAPSNQSPAQFQERIYAAASPSPVLSRKAFRPVAPPPVEREVVSLPPPPPPPPTEAPSSSMPVVDVRHGPSQDRVTVKPLRLQPAVRPGAEWERTSSPSVQSDESLPPVPDNEGVVRVCPSETYYSQVNNHHQQQQLCMRRVLEVEEQQKIIQEPGTESETTLSPSPAQSLEADLDVPMETDIDDFQEEDLPTEDMPITSELPCFALPVRVLETDIDTLPDAESSPSGGMQAESSSLEEELEAGESSRETLSLEELFPQTSEGESGTESWRGHFQTVEQNTDSLDRRSGASSSCSSYYSTSAAKAQILSQMKDFTDERDEDDELTYKKQLMESLRKKLGVLREAQRGLQEDIRANSQLGDEVESMVVSVCKPNEVDKFRMFIGDLDKVVSLLLSLSGRLLRVETTLETMDPETEHHERLPLLEKKRQLMRQLSEAQDLKDHIDRREQAVSRVLARCLSPEQHRDYSHFVKMKAALLVEQKQLEDKIRLGEEQLRGLRESLGLGLGIGMGMSMGYGHF